MNGGSWRDGEKTNDVTHQMERNVRANVRPTPTFPTHFLFGFLAGKGEDDAGYGRAQTSACRQHRSDSVSLDSTIIFFSPSKLSSPIIFLPHPRQGRCVSDSKA